MLCYLSPNMQCWTPFTVGNWLKWVKKIKLAQNNFFLNQLFTQKDEFNLKTYDSALLNIYRISVGENEKTLKEKKI